MFISISSTFNFIIITIILVNGSLAFNNNKINSFYKPKSKTSTELNLLLAPQIAFAAACAGAVFTYVWNNIDEIKEKQAIAKNATMSKQASDLKSTQETQRANIERIQEEQRINILKAKLQVEEATRKNQNK